MGDQAYGIGGYDSGGNYKTALYRYDLSDDVWTAMTSCLYQRGPWSTGASAYIDGYVFGGPSDSTGFKKVEKYDIAGNSWTIKNDQITNDGGANRPSPIAGRIYASEWKYDYINDVWSWGCSLSNLEVDFGVGGIIYGASNADNNWKYTPGTGVKALITSCPTYHQFGGTWVDGTNGFVVAGGINNPPTDACERYNIASNTWTSRTGQGQACRFVGSFVISGMGHSFGGSKYPDSIFNIHQRFDDGANIWTSKAVYPGSWAAIRGFYVPANFPPNAPLGLSVSAI